MKNQRSLIAVVACTWVLPATGLAANGEYFKIDYPAAAHADGLQTPVTYTLWVPQGVQTLRGVIVHQHGASIPAAQAGGTAAYDLHWQELAKKWDCALLGPSYHVLNDATDLTPGGAEWWFDPRKGSEKAFLRALDDFGAKTGHPEMATVPWCLWGHSGGGVWSNIMSALHPDRVVALFLRSGTATMFRNRAVFPQPELPAAVYSIPTMTNAGEGEKSRAPWTGSIATFKEYRAQGAPIGFTPDPRTAHFCGDSRYVAIPFLDACLAMRLPDKGSKDQRLKPVSLATAWYAPLLGAVAQSAIDFKGNVKEAVWLPNADVARAWMEYVKTGTVADATAPPAPFDVKVTKTGFRSVEITWAADADFESGLGAFAVLRDGWVVGQVPAHPPDRIFGRPLFQGLSYHDTPEAPIAEMRFVDNSTNPKEKHVYTVVALNSAGVRSEPSAEAALPAAP